MPPPLAPSAGCQTCYTLAIHTCAYGNPKTPVISGAYGRLAKLAGLEGSNTFSVFLRPRTAVLSSSLFCLASIASLANGLVSKAIRLARPVAIPAPPLASRVLSAMRPAGGIIGGIR